MANSNVTNDNMNEIIIIISTSDSSVDIRTDWKDITTYLGLSAENIADIEAENTRPRTMNVMRSILGKFVKSCKEQPTIQKVIDALRKAGFEKAAKALESKYPCEPSNEDFADFSILKYLRFGKPDYQQDFKVNPKLLVPSSIAPPLQPMRFKNDDYKLPVKNKGYALIINILKFDKAEDRGDAAHDTSNIFHLFMDLGYLPLHYTDKIGSITSEKFAIIIEEFKILCLHKNVSSFVVYLGSHGSEGYLQLSNGESVNYYKNVIGTLCDPGRTGSHKNWSKIPKLFFIQACRTPPTDGEEENIDNALVCFACSVGQTARRHPESGSYFVRSLAQNFRMFAHCKELWEMLETVKKEVKELTSSYGDQDVDFHRIGKFGKLYFNLDP